MTAFLTIVFLLGILGFLIFIHELGHFLAAKLVGVPVEEFAIGFGPVIFSKTYKGTAYRIRLLPLGGFVALTGEHDTEAEHGFRNKPFLPKAFVLLAGICMNILAAIIIGWLFLVARDYRLELPAATDHTFSFAQQQDRLFPVRIASVPENLGFEGIAEDDFVVAINEQYFSNADEFFATYESVVGTTASVTTINIETYELSTQEATFGNEFVRNYELIQVSSAREGSSLEEGMVIIGAEGTIFSDPRDLPERIQQYDGTEITLQILDTTTGSISDLVAELETNENGEKQLGITFNTLNAPSVSLVDVVGDNGYYFLTFDAHPLLPFTFSGDLTLYQVKFLGTLLGQAIQTSDFEPIGEAFGSPIAVGNVVNTVVEFESYDTLLFITTLVSLSLAIFNIIPIPALDGGQLAIAAYESLSKRKLSDESLNRINLVGFVFVMGLSLLIIFKDVVQFEILDSIGEGIENIFGN